MRVLEVIRVSSKDFYFVGFVGFVDLWSCWICGVVKVVLFADLDLALFLFYYK